MVHTAAGKLPFVSHERRFQLAVTCRGLTWSCQNETLNKTGPESGLSYLSSLLFTQPPLGPFFCAISYAKITTHLTKMFFFFFTKSEGSDHRPQSVFFL